MLIQDPQNALLADHRARLPASIDLVARIRRVLFEVNVQLIDFDRAKARNRDVQIFFDQQFGKVRQLDRQTRAIPAGVVADLIVGKSKGCTDLPNFS